MTGGGKKHAAILIGAATLGMTFNDDKAGAQEAPASPLTIEATVEAGVEVNDNGRLAVTSPGTDTTYYTTLGIVVGSETATQTLNLSFGADLQYEDLAGSATEENGVEKPYVRLNYRANGADSRLGFNAAYRKDDILNSVFLDTDADEIEDTILSSQGQIARTDYGVTYSFGVEAPFGMDLSASRKDRDYSDVVDPRLFDRTTDEIGAVARFRINPAATARLIARSSMYSADDAVSTERDTTDLGVGLNYAITPDLTLDAQVTQTQIEETTTGGTTESDGVSARVGVVRDLANGNFGLSVARTQYTDTARTDVLATRALELAQGRFSFGIGVSSSDTGDTVMIGSIDYENEVATGVITASLRRSATVNDNNEEVERTILGLGYNHEINEVSGLSIGLEVADAKDIGAGTTTDSTRADFSVTYSRALTEDWNWNLGYVGRYKDSSSSSSASSNAIVTSIGRSFSLRP